MALPEMVIQYGVERAWKFLQERLDYIVRFLLAELPTGRQEDYRELIRNDKVQVLMGFPQATIRVPAFYITLQSDSEEHQFVGDQGPGFVDPIYLAGVGDYQEEPEFFGVSYPDTEEPQFLNHDGELSSAEVRQFPPREKNAWIQRESGPDADEQFERMQRPSALWHRDRQRLGSTAFGDRVVIGIQIVTDNAEKTMVYYRLLRWVLRRFMTWFSANGVINPVFTGSDLMPLEFAQPTLLYQRTLTISFNHIDRSVHVEAILAGWMFEVEMVTKNGEGELQGVTLIKIP